MHQYPSKTEHIQNLEELTVCKIVGTVRRFQESKYKRSEKTKKLRTVRSQKLRTVIDQKLQTDGEQKLQTVRKKACQQHNQPDM